MTNKKEVQDILVSEDDVKQIEDAAFNRGVFRGLIGAGIVTIGSMIIGATVWNDKNRPKNSDRFDHFRTLDKKETEGKRK